MDPVIKGRGLKTVIYFLPFWLPFLPFFAIMLYAIILPGEIACETLFGFSLFQLNLISLCYAFPVFSSVISLWLTLFAYKVVKHGYFPPLDSKVMFDTLCKKGKFQSFRGWVLLIICPLFSLYALIAGHYAYSELSGKLTETVLNEVCNKE